MAGIVDGGLEGVFVDAGRLAGRVGVVRRELTSYVLIKATPENN